VLPKNQGMKMNRMILALTGMLAVPAVAEAQVELRVHVPLPTIRFEVAPPLVVVTEGVQVVPDYPEEVFYREGFYWHRSSGRWYRAGDHRGGWVVVERRYVPVAMLAIPAGKYKHHKHKASKPHPGKGHAFGHAPGPGRGHGHGGGKHKSKGK
jgi:hypothetical protein